MAAGVSIRAGAAALPIAPTAAELEQGIWLGGYGSYRARRAAGVHDDPCCRALALEGGESAFVIAAVDMIGVAGAVLADVRSSVLRTTGLPPGRLLIASTHSHSSPDLQGLWGGVPRSYVRRLVEVCIQAVRQALDSLTEAHLAAGSTELQGVTVNRRGWPEVDEELVVLRAVRPDGSPVGALVNFACHGTAIGPQSVLVSRDWPGFAVDALEQELGGVVVYVNGAQGDVNPAESGEFGQARRLGEAVASAACAAAANAEDVDGPLHLASASFRIPLQQERLPSWAPRAVSLLNPALGFASRSGVFKRAADLAAGRGRAATAQVLAGLSMAAGHGLEAGDGAPWVPTRAGYLRLGSQVEGFAAPGEVMTRLAKGLKASLSAPRQLFLGLTYDSLGYFIPEDEWMTGRNGNYEESVSTGRAAAPSLVAALDSLRAAARAG